MPGPSDGLAMISNNDVHDFMYEIRFDTLLNVTMACQIFVLIFVERDQGVVHSIDLISPPTKTLPYYTLIKMCMVLHHGVSNSLLLVYDMCMMFDAERCRDAHTKVFHQ